MFLRYFGKSVRLKVCMSIIFRIFFHTKSMYKVIWSSKNVMNITKTLNMRETYLDLIGKFVTVGKITYNICGDWLNPYIIATVFLFDWKLKFCWSSSIFGPFWGQNLGLGLVRNGKKRLISYQPPDSQPSSLLTH